MVDGTGEGEIWWACGGVVLTGDLKGLDSAEGVVLKRRRLGAGVVDMVTDPTAPLFTALSRLLEAVSWLNLSFEEG